MSNQTEDQRFNELVQEHAIAWRKVGESNPSICYDPARAYHLQDARECSEKLIKAFAERGRLPNSIQEALNSGYGVYRP